jgi:hypothetical protein
MKLLRSQRGVIDLVIIVFIVGLLAVAGASLYYQHQTQLAAQKAADANSETALVTKKAPAVDPTASWTAYSDATGKFSLKYQPAWKKQNCGTEGIATVFLAPTAAAQAICSSGHGAQITIYSSAGDTSSAQVFKAAAGFSGITTVASTINGVTGTLSKATFGGNAGSNLPAGTIEERYVFVTRGRTFIANYIQSPSGDYATNVQSDFELIVTNTWRFI